jgi:hypothetical protein
LEDLKEYLEKIDIPLPERLFPSLSSDDFTSPENIFRQEGDGWYVCFAGKGFRFKNITGFKYIHLLLDRPNQLLYASDLVNMKIHPSAMPATDGSEETRESIDKMAKTKFSPEEEENEEEGWREDEVQDGKQDKKYDEDLASMQSCKGKKAGTLLNREGLRVSSSIDRNYRIIDSQTKDIYRFRLQQIEEQLEGGNNPEVSLALKEEKARLEEEVNRFARTVSSGSDEKARKNVSEACRRAYKEIGKHNPSLQGYLRRHIKLGNGCMYQPDPSHPISWILV